MGRRGEKVTSCPWSEKSSVDLSISKSVIRRASKGRDFRAGRFDRLQQIVTGPQCDDELKTRRGHYEIPEHL
jgi:hypothetical protein